MVARVIRISTIPSNMFVNNLIIFCICNRFLSAYKWSRSTFFEESLKRDIGINLHSFLFKSYQFFYVLTEFKYQRDIFLKLHATSSACWTKFAALCLIILCKCEWPCKLYKWPQRLKPHSLFRLLFFCLLFINIFLHADRVKAMLFLLRILVFLSEDLHLVAWTKNGPFTKCNTNQI